MHTIAWFGFPPKSLVKGGSFLQDVEIGHGASRQDHYTRIGGSGSGLQLRAVVLKTPNGRLALPAGLGVAALDAAALRCPIDESL